MEKLARQRRRVASKLDVTNKEAIEKIKTVRADFIDEVKATKRLYILANRQVEYAAKQKEIQDKLASIALEAQILLRGLGVEEFVVPGLGTHQFKPGRTNNKNTVRPKDFMELAGDNAFWISVEVPIGKAKKCLGEKDLSRVTDTIPGHPTDPVYKFVS